MKRFRGEQLKPAARIALLTGEALGNYVVATPLIQMLRGAYPDAQIHYFGGRRTKELWDRESMIDVGNVFIGVSPRKVALASIAKGPFDLVINLEDSEWARCFASLLADDDTYVAGPILNELGRDILHSQRDLRGALWRDPDWTCDDLIQWYPFLDSGFIGELFCRLCYLEGPIPPYRVAEEKSPIPAPSVLLSLAASSDSKLWPIEKWTIVLRALMDNGKSVGIVGAKHQEQRQIWRGSEMEDALLRQGDVIDLRGRLSLPQVVGALKDAEMVVSIDNGVLHLACAAGVKSVGLYRYGHHRLWAPPSPQLTVLAPDGNEAVSSITVSAVRHATGL